MGHATHVDIERLLGLREQVATWLSGEALHGTLWRAGLPKTFRSEAR
jgi:hydroxymethylglutaryl-CoA lyase